MKKSLTEYNFPSDLKEMTLNELTLLSYEIRDFLLEKVSRTGGHLASNLGVVELSIALHRAFESPVDKIIWDVGHQSYVHKILTGRADRFDTLRQLGGMSGFPNTAESEHDVFNAGHSSNSISNAAGIAAAGHLNGESNYIISVIGDGALTGGLAYEALNNINSVKSKVIVILNDNGMSISKNIGGVSQHLSRLRTSKGYLGFKHQVKKVLKSSPGLYQGAEHFKDTIKYAFVDGALFEELGFTYLGPVDGHSIEELLSILELAKRAEGPVLVHAITKKGKGYRNAEMNPNKFHGIAPFDLTTGIELSKSQKPSYSNVFGDKLTEMAACDDRITAVCAAMIDGTGLEGFAQKYPDRTFDVGIAEEHAVSFAAGLARAGKIPVVAIYSTFLQRAYDEIMIDVCLNKLPVIFAIDRAGIVGADGQTHHGIFDISYLSHIPNLTLLSPRDGAELEEMLEYAVKLNGPCAIRYPRGEAAEFNDGRHFSGQNYFMVNRSESGGKTDAEIWASGRMVSIAAGTARLLEEKGHTVSIVNAAVLKPFDDTLLKDAASRTKNIVTMEDNVLSGGFCQNVNSFILENNVHVGVKNLGWPDTFIEHGSPDKLLEIYGLSESAAAERICEFLERQA